jgi:hypothetical protein
MEAARQIMELHSRTLSRTVMVIRLSFLREILTLPCTVIVCRSDGRSAPLLLLLFDVAIQSLSAFTLEGTRFRCSGRAMWNEFVSG